MLSLNNTETQLAQIEMEILFGGAAGAAKKIAMESRNFGGKYNP